MTWHLSGWLMVAVVVLCAADAQAFPSFGAAGTSNNCQDCHTLFGDGPGDAEHDAHRSGVTGCEPCHGAANYPALLASPTFPSATGCVGCHGRDQDAGGDTESDGFGRGLRQHHANAGVGVCADCHSDTDSMTLPAAGENVQPPLYATYTFLDACDGSEERFASATTSLDNDGDLLYDAADPDCAVVTTTTVITSTTTSTTSSTTTSTSTSSTTTLPPAVVPGGGSGRSDCYVEVVVDGITNPGDQIRKGRQVYLTDGEAGDRGPCGDQKCLIRAAVCINQPDPNLGDCTPPPQLDKLRVGGKVILPTPSSLSGPVCGAPSDVEVTAKVKRDAQGNVKRARPGKVKMRLSAVAPKGTKPRKDADAVTFVCVPRPVPCE